MRLYYALPIQNAEKVSIHSESTIHGASCIVNMVFNLKMWLARCRQSHRFQLNTSGAIQRHIPTPTASFGGTKRVEIADGVTAAILHDLQLLLLGTIAHLARSGVKVDMI